MLNKKTQDDHVKEELGFQPELIREKVNLPGIRQLHEQPAADIAEVLATLIKSRNDVKEIHYVVGEGIEIVSAPVKY